ncbi:1836_t:CDS:2 [Rhizophagus irregularis]|nr:1836_t:CDS:2 [Rhizophagus irregularis]
MSSKNYGQKTCETPQIPKFCSDCEEMSDSVKLFSSKNTIYQKFCNNNNKYSSTIENIDNNGEIDIFSNNSSQTQILCIKIN